MEKFTIDRFKNAVDEAKSAVKAKMGTETEKKIEEALNNKNWGASNTLLNDLAQLTREYEDYNLIMKKIWEAISAEARQWRTIFKALTLLDHLVKNGTDRVVENARDNVFKIRGLLQFSYFDGTSDKGAGVREKAKQVLDLLSDNTRIKDEREKSRRLRDKYVGIGSNRGSAGSYPGATQNNYSYSSGGTSYSKNSYDAYAAPQGGDNTRDSYANGNYNKNDNQNRNTWQSSGSLEGSSDDYKPANTAPVDEKTKKDSSLHRAPSNEISLLDQDLFEAPKAFEGSTERSSFDAFSNFQAQHSAAQPIASNFGNAMTQSLVQPSEQQPSLQQLRTMQQQFQPSIQGMQTPGQNSFYSTANTMDLQQNVGQSGAQFYGMLHMQQNTSMPGSFSNFSSAVPTPNILSNQGNFMVSQQSNMESFPPFQNPKVESTSFNSYPSPAPVLPINMQSSLKPFPPEFTSSNKSVNPSMPNSNINSSKYIGRENDAANIRTASPSDAWGAGSNLFNLSDIKPNPSNANNKGADITFQQPKTFISQNSFNGLDTLAGMPTKTINPNSAPKLNDLQKSNPMQYVGSGNSMNQFNTFMGTAATDQQQMKGQTVGNVVVGPYNMQQLRGPVGPQMAINNGMPNAQIDTTGMMQQQFQQPFGNMNAWNNQGYGNPSY